MIWISISDPRSLGSWCIKGTDESVARVDSSVPLMHHNPSDLGSLIRLRINPKERTHNLQFLSCFLPRYIRTLTFDIILSTAFGVQSECQTNPDDPTMMQARDALRFSPVALTIIGLGLLLPYGSKLLKLLSPWLFKNFQGIKNVADQVIRTSKRKEEGTEKVSLTK